MNGTSKKLSKILTAHACMWTHCRNLEGILVEIRKVNCPNCHERILYDKLAFVDEISLRYKFLSSLGKDYLNLSCSDMRNYPFLKFSY